MDLLFTMLFALRNRIVEDALPYAFRYDRAYRTP
jgi:hypothetical protein